MIGDPDEERKSRDEKLRESVEMLANDFDMSEVEPWIDLQREAFTYIDFEWEGEFFNPLPNC